MSSPSFDAPAGRIIGWRDGRVIRATGIRYARAVRFQPPTPQPASSTSIEATEWAPACAQADHPFGMGLMQSSVRTLATSEECLRLSITRPDDMAPGDLRPVMVWIHGGSYVFGAGDAAIYDARALVEEQSVIVVSITYRLGLLGFLGGEGGRDANVGLLDIIEALRWVKTNIAAFGGDADNITLFGQSAGGDAIAHLMIAEGAQDLFRRVIIQSAPLGISLGRRKMYEAMLKIAAHVAHDASTEDVIAAQASVVSAAHGFGWPASMPFGTQYGHHPLPSEDELDSAWSRCAGRFDVLIGSAAEEGSFFIPTIEPLRKVAALPLLGDALRRVIVSTITRKVYAAAADRFAKRHARAGGRAYIYKIHWGSKTNQLGATHAIDLPLLFGDEPTWRDADLVAGLSWPEVHASGQKVRALWSSFARVGSLDVGAIEPTLVSYRRAS
jgi:para-nitrobenzyl esterase